MATKQHLLEELIVAYGGDIAAVEEAVHDYKRATKLKASASTPRGPVLVELKNITRQYKLGKHPVVALNDASLTVHQGELIALVGPSGSGKSTILNIISGLDTPDSGSVMVDGQDVSKMNNNQRARFRSLHLGFVFQFFYLQPFLSLQSNVEVPAMFAGISRAERATRSESLINAVGLGDRIKHLPKELSGGQMQRAAIARALLNQPKLLLADEPTGNLDSTNALEVIELFQKVRKDFGTTVIIVTHDQKIAAQADRVIELHDGKVVA